MKIESQKQVFNRGLSLISRTVNGQNKEYYHFNTHGDTIALTNTSGQITKDYQYDAFGNQKQEISNDNNPFRYAGEYFDSETNFIYLRARYYDSSLGRFISEDPIKDGKNWFVYCGNNPVMFVDPTGLFDLDALEELLMHQEQYNGARNKQLKHEYANKMRTILKNNPQFLEKWAPNSELHSLLLEITSDSSFESGNSIEKTKRAIKLTKKYWKDYHDKNIKDNLLFMAGETALITPIVKIGLSYLQSTVVVNKGIKFAKSAAEHMTEAGKFVPIQILQEAIKHGIAKPDPQGTSAVMYYANMYRNGKMYNLEVLFDKSTNTIFHFMYK